jgi:hypothetical protein
MAALHRGPKLAHELQQLAGQVRHGLPVLISLVRSAALR